MGHDLAWCNYCGDYVYVDGHNWDTPHGKIVRRMDTPAARAFWKSAEVASSEVSTWPDWKRAGINVAQVRPTPRRLPAKRKRFIDKRQGPVATKTMAGRRDASWYAKPGRAEFYHVAIHSGSSWLPACNKRGREEGARGVLLVEQTLIDAADVRPGQRCRRIGCWSKWPRL